MHRLYIRLTWPQMLQQHAGKTRLSYSHGNWGSSSFIFSFLWVFCVMRKKKKTLSKMFLPQEFKTCSSPVLLLVLFCLLFCMKGISLIQDLMAYMAERDFGDSFAQNFTEAICKCSLREWYFLLRKKKLKQLVYPFQANKSYLLSHAVFSQFTFCES